MRLCTGHNSFSHVFFLQIEIFLPVGHAEDGSGLGVLKFGDRVFGVVAVSGESGSAFDVQVDLVVDLVNLPLRP